MANRTIYKNVDVGQREVVPSDLHCLNRCNQRTLSLLSFLGTQTILGNRSV